MAPVAEYGMSRTSDWEFNFDNPTINLEDTPLNGDAIETSSQSDDLESNLGIHDPGDALSNIDALRALADSENPGDSSGLPNQEQHAESHDEPHETLTGPQLNKETRSAMPKNTSISPRPPKEGDHESSPHTKKPRTSLFGGGNGNPRDGEDENLNPQLIAPRASLFGGGTGYMDKDEEDAPAQESQVTQEFGSSSQSFGTRMSSLRLDEQPNDPDQVEDVNRLDFDLENSDIGSVGESPAPSDEDGFVIPPDTQAPYQLRQNIDRNRVFTYHDADESGNYNPEVEEAKEKAQRVSKAKATKRWRRKGKGKHRSTKKSAKSEQTPQPIQGCVQCRNDGEDCSIADGGGYPCEWCKYNDHKCCPGTKVTEKGKYEPKDMSKLFKKHDQETTKVKPKKKATKPKSKKPAASQSLQDLEAGSAYLTAKDFEDMDGDEDRAPSRETTPEMVMEDHAGNRGPVTKIETSFAHPIRFSIGVPQQADCDFCGVPHFSILGYFEKTVHVIQWDSGLGYTEIGGGHCEDNGPTAMCETCAMNRIQIVSCEMHDLQRICEADEMAFENNLTDLMGAEDPFEVHEQLQRWCSMCFSPAIFACCSAQVHCGNEETIGCGLRLCEPCEIQLREVYGGSSSAMAEALDREPKLRKSDREMNYGQTIRADVGFLSAQGLLQRNVEWQMEQMDLMEE